MIKKKNSSVSRKPSKAANKGATFGRDFIAGARQILAHVERRKVLKEYTLPMPVDVERHPREGWNVADTICRSVCLNHRTLQQWEQGKASPDLAVRAYLTVIERNPDVVKAALRR